MTSALNWSDRAGVPVLTDRSLDRSDLVVAFTCRVGGLSAPPYATLNLSDYVGDEDAAVSGNKEIALAAGGFEPGSLASLRQVHGTDVTTVEAGQCGTLGEADALSTSATETTLGVLAADCVPVLMRGPGGIAAAHAGWRGLVAGVLEAAAASVEATSAWIGPCIHACCYEVGPEVVEAFEDAGLPVADDRHVDPGRGAAVALRRAGVDSVVAATECTSCDDRFFSYRRDGQTGRQAGLIALR